MKVNLIDKKVFSSFYRTFENTSMFISCSINLYRTVQKGRMFMGRKKEGNQYVAVRLKY